MAKYQKLARFHPYNYGHSQVWSDRCSLGEIEILDLFQSYIEISKSQTHYNYLIFFSIFGTSPCLKLIFWDFTLKVLIWGLKEQPPPLQDPNN